MTIPNIPDSTTKKSKADASPRKNGGDGGKKNAKPTAPAKGKNEAAAAPVTEKKVGERTHLRDDFLIVIDEAQPATWYLPVKIKGNVSRRLAGAAWAALFGSNGLKGKRYQGPNMAEARRHLRAIYKAHKWSIPDGESDVEEDMNIDELALPVEEMDARAGATTFVDLETQRRANQASFVIGDLTWDFHVLIDNILGSPEISNKLLAIQSLAGEFLARADTELKKINQPSEKTEPTDEETKETSGQALTELTENAVTVFKEAEDGDEFEGRPTFGYLHFKLIEPGWGNTQDNNYYPEEVVRRDSGMFVGSKMYEAEHLDEQKSTRTWVSTVIARTGFTETGAPIMKSAIHDPGFNERVKNLKKLGLIEKLHNSIMGRAEFTPDFEKDGREGKRIDKFTAAGDVDWVTNAGAGGHAMQLSESATGSAHNGGKTMTGEEKKKKKEEATEESAEKKVTPFKEQAEKPKEKESDFLASDRVKELLEASKLPAVTQEKLIVGKYLDAEALKETIQAERKYIATISGAGKVTSMGGVAESEKEKPVEVERLSKDKVNEKYEDIMTRHGVRLTPR